MSYKLGKKEVITPFVLGVTATFLTILFAYRRGIETTVIQDAKDYVGIAQNMVPGWNFMVSNPDYFQRTIGFPFVIFLTFLLTNSSSLLMIKVLLAIGHGVSTFLVARIGEQIGLRKVLWVLGAALFALDPFLLFAATDVQTESITTLIVLYWAYLYLSPNINSKAWILLFICFPISGFIAITIRPNIILPFIFVAFILYARWVQFGVKRLWIVGAGTLFIGLMVIYHVILTSLYKGFVFLSAQGGIGTIFTCRTELIPQYLGIASATKNTEINQWVLDHLGNVVSGVIAANPDISTGDVNSELYKISWATCVANPLQSFFVLFIKTFALWRPFTVFGAYDFNTFILSALIWVPLTTIMIWFVVSKNLTGSNLLLRKYFVVLSISFTISLLLTPTQIRHRIAFAEPFYWLFLMHYISIIWSKRGLQKILRNSNFTDSRSK